MRTTLATILATLLSAAAAAVTVEDNLPLAAYGNPMEGTDGRIVPLTPTSFLVGSEGPDLTQWTADDQVLLVEDVGGSPTVTPLATPYLPDWSQRILRLSTSRAVTMGLGPDGANVSGDEVLFLLDGLGTTNTVTPITVGSLARWEHSAPATLGTGSVVLSGRAVGASFDDGDPGDVVYVVSDLGGTNTVTTLPAPYLTFPARPLVLSPTTFLVTSMGPDAVPRTGDEQLYVFHDAGSGFARSDVALSSTDLYRSSVGARISPTSAIVVAAGPDLAYETADDEIVLIEGADGTPAATGIPVPGILSWGAGAPVVVGDTVLVSTVGADLTPGTPDDAVAMLSDVGGANTVTPVVVGPLDDGPAHRPHFLSGERVVLASLGADATGDSADDALVVISDVGGANALASVPLPGIDWGASFVPLALAPDALLILSGGADGSIGGGDDELVEVTGIGATPMKQSVPAGGDISQCCHAATSPQPLGKGRAARAESGADDFLGSGGDDGIQILSDLPGVRDLTVEKLRVKFDPAKPEKGEKANLKALLTLDGLPPLGSTDLIVSVAGAAQVLPAAAFEAKKKSIVYSDKKNEQGFVKKLSFKPEKGKLTLKTKGVGTGMEGLDPDHVAVALEWRVFDQGPYLSDAIAATAVKKGVKYKRPKQ